MSSKFRETLIIAEAGANHNGDFNLAKKMIRIAKNSGADIIKFQIGKSSVSKYAPQANYQKRNMGSDESQLKMLNKLRLSFEQHKELKEECDFIGIQYLASPFDLESVEYLSTLKIPFWKIPSGEITNLPLLEKIGSYKMPIFLSTGMGELNEIAEAIAILEKRGSNDITLLQCNTQYPTPYEDVNLKVMNSLKKEFRKPVGFSDHSLGIEVPIAAVAMGACVIEKHFTLDKTMKGPDHVASLEPNELARMISSIRNIEKSMGIEEKKCTASEFENKAVARKSIVANRTIKAGEIFTEENLTTKRPGTGISPMKWYEILGKSAKKDFKEDELIEV